MVAVLVCQFVFLSLRGGMRGACPLRDLGEVLAFLAWSLTLFYLIIGRAYRWSPTGVFTAPLVVVFQSVALAPGVLEPKPERAVVAVPWMEGHAAMSVLSYGALGAAAVTAAMFLVLDRKLKGKRLVSGWFRALPPVRELLVALVRLLRLGVLLLSVGIGCGVMVALTGGVHEPGHLVAAVLAWVGYLLLLVLQHFRGLSGRRLAQVSVAWFVVSLMVFAFL